MSAWRKRLKLAVRILQGDLIDVVDVPPPPPPPHPGDHAASMREVRFCQSRGHICKTPVLCGHQQFCSKPDEAYRTIRYVETEEAHKMGVEAFRADHDMLWNCPFNGTQNLHRAQAFYKLGYLEALYEWLNSREGPIDWRARRKRVSDTSMALLKAQEAARLAGRTYIQQEQDAINARLAPVTSEQPTIPSPSTVTGGAL